jgi:hypothetical protein
MRTGWIPPYDFFPSGAGDISPRGFGSSPMEFRQPFEAAFFPLPRSAVLCRPLFLSAHARAARHGSPSLGPRVCDDNFMMARTMLRRGSFAPSFNPV